MSGPQCLGGRSALFRARCRRRFVLRYLARPRRRGEPASLIGQGQGGTLHCLCRARRAGALPMVDELRTLFQRAGSPGEIELYPGVYHGFAFRNAGATTSRPRSAIGSGSSPSVGGVWARTEPPQSIELQRSAVQLFGSLDLDQHSMPLLLRVAVLFGLDQPTPHLFIYRSRAVDLRPAVKSGDATLR
jgi:hypothetical protein